MTCNVWNNIIFKLLTVLFLKTVKKVRGFDKSFKVYYPDFNNGRAVLLWRLKVVNPLLNIDVNFKTDITSDVPIDIFIPVSIKDVEVLPHTMQGALSNIKHPINKIYIVAQQHEVILKICMQFNAVFINEGDVPGYPKEKLNYVVNGRDRSGWLLQQLLKLNADGVVETENYLILDADTIFLKPKVFIDKGKTIFDMSQERYLTYHLVYERILKRKTTSALSFIAHQMLFNKTALSGLKAEIEAIHHKKWDEAILANVDYNDASGFSEYELYGNYFAEKFPEQTQLAYWFNSTSAANAKHIKTRSVHARLN